MTNIFGHTLKVLTIVPCAVDINYILNKSHFWQIHILPVNRLTGSYFYSVTGYDLLASFTALSDSLGLAFFTSPQWDSVVA